MKVRIEQSFEDREVTLADMKQFVEAVEAAAGDSWTQTVVIDVEIDFDRFVYEREN